MTETNALLLVIIAILFSWWLWMVQHHNELIQFIDALSSMIGEALDERNE